MSLRASLSTTGLSFLYTLLGGRAVRAGCDLSCSGRLRLLAADLTGSGRRGGGRRPDKHGVVGQAGWLAVVLV
jgi:hypothetical protein